MGWLGANSGGVWQRARLGVGPDGLKEQVAGWREQGRGGWVEGGWVGSAARAPPPAAPCPQPCCCPLPPPPQVGEPGAPAPELCVPIKLSQGLRYGENPHQPAAFYADASLAEHGRGGVATAVQHNGKEMSYNNYLDADAGGGGRGRGQCSSGGGCVLAQGLPGRRCRWWGGGRSNCVSWPGGCLPAARLLARQPAWPPACSPTCLPTCLPSGCAPRQGWGGKGRALLAPSPASPSSTQQPSFSPPHPTHPPGPTPPPLPTPSLTPTPPHPACSLQRPNHKP